MNHWEILYPYINQLLLALLCAVCAWAGSWVRMYLSRFHWDGAKITAARTAAQCVEQVYRDLHGEAKLRKALEKAELLLRSRNIPFDAEEMTILIEAAVSEFNKSFARGGKAAG